MKKNNKEKIEDMYKNVNKRPVELVFYGHRIKKSIGLRRPPSDLLRELDDDLDRKKDNNPIKRKLLIKFNKQLNSQ